MISFITIEDVEFNLAQLRTGELISELESRHLTIKEKKRLLSFMKIIASQEKKLKGV